jgi:Skp family chaperone for outer membrane proteins
MKRCVLLTAFCACLIAPLARAQDPLTAAAEKQEAEERYKTLTARLENLEEAIQAYQKRMNDMATEIRSLREDLARMNVNAVQSATQKSLENLAKAIEEVDRKRLSDNEKVLKTLDDVRRGLAERPSSPPKPPPATGGGGNKTPKDGKEKGYEYVVQANDNPSVISAKLAKQGLKVSSRQIMEANPSINWSRLKIGQKLFIPEPTP